MIIPKNKATAPVLLPAVTATTNKIAVNRYLIPLLFIHNANGKKYRDGLNISVYNVLGRPNDIYYTLKYYNGEFRFWHVTFLVKQLPNISYYIKF